MDGSNGLEMLISTSTVPETTQSSRPALVAYSCDGLADFMAAVSTGFMTGETAASVPIDAIGIFGVNIDEKMPCPIATSATAPAIRGALSAVIVAGSLVGTLPINPPPSSLLPPPQAANNTSPAVAMQKFLSACFIAISHANQPDFRMAGTAKM